MAASTSEPKKAFFTTWGDSDDELDVGEDKQGKCLMAQEDSDDDEPVKVSSIKLSVLPKEELINLCQGLIEDNDTLMSQADEYTNEISVLKAETIELSKRLHAEPVVVTKFCELCKGKSNKHPSDSNVSTKLDTIMDKLDKLTKSIDAKTVNQTVFVRARPGLGYSPEDATSCSQDVPLTISLTAKIESLSKELQSCKSKNDHLEHKMQALEENPKDTKRWFHGKKAHQLYLKQVKHTTPQ